MANAVVGGIGTYGPMVAYGPGISPLWKYMRMPPAQNSLIIYDDGSVVEGAHFENDDIAADDVHLYHYGGTIFTVEVGSFAYNALEAAGYLLEEIPEPDTYTDDYQDVY
jgi:hypothetical protein